MADIRVAGTNSIFSADFVESLDEQLRLGLSDVDLKDSIMSKELIDLTDEDVERVDGLLRARDMQVYSLSTNLFGGRIEVGREDFHRDHLTPVDRAVELAAVFRPRYIRLFACRTSSRPPGTGLDGHLHAAAPWLIETYQAAVDTFAAAGFDTTIENETEGSILAAPADVEVFFGLLDRPSASLTWDIQNMWQASGTMPSIAMYHQVRRFTGYVHVKGGSADPAGHLQWKAPLRAAAWPVEEIVAEVARDGISPVICVNPCHGRAPEHYDPHAVAVDDVRYVQELLARTSPVSLEGTTPRPR